MERVHFEQEHFLSDLKQLVQKEILTPKEAKTVLHRRSELERALVRRVPHKSDFLRYIDYERSLDKLCRIRATKTNTKAPHTRQFHIFERALKKFKDDVGLWIQYIQLAENHGARSLVSRISARAIQLHPTYAPFYILAAAHELENGSPAAARTLLQRGIRLNETSIDLWREYVKMELVFVENLRRRWAVLGIPDTDNSEVLDGAIVRSVMDNAFKGRSTLSFDVLPLTKEAIPTLDLFHALEPVLADSPLASHLHALLDKFLLPHSSDALRIFLARTVRHDMDQLELVDAMKLASDKMVYCVAHGGPEISNVVSEFIEEWLASEMDASLVRDSNEQCCTLTLE